MISAMIQLMEKPNWESKVLDEVITAKWKAEALAQGGFTEPMWDYCLAELRDKAKSFEKTGIAEPIDVDCKIVYSDRAVPADVTRDLIDAVSRLENVPDHLKDWHPGSNNQVLDLVHPSLFPLIYGRSNVITNGTVGLEDCTNYCGQGEALPVPDLTRIYAHTNSGENLFSQNFQWLPCEVRFDEHNDTAHVTSYINNLHPVRYRGLYQIIEKVISRSIPLWDVTLASVLDESPEARIDISDFLQNEEGRYSYPQGEEHPQVVARKLRQRENSRSELADQIVETNGDQFSESIGEESDNDSEDDWELNDVWQEQTRVLNAPEPGTYLAPNDVQNESEVKFHLRQHFADQGLQVIVKFANIYLDPAKPDYAGGSWHIEGQLNEHIVATSLFYYDQSNIGPSYLEFRHNVDVEESSADWSYEQERYACFADLLGIPTRMGDPGIQDLGRIHTKQGRLLAFPNVLQHRVPPFSLADNTRPGHRKILALFLVDPNLKILSTANVPPQQNEWWTQAVRNTEIKHLSDLPPELNEKVLELADDFPMSLEQAKEIRLALMKERSRTSRAAESMAPTFNFCEH